MHNKAIGEQHGADQRFSDFVNVASYRAQHYRARYLADYSASFKSRFQQGQGRLERVAGHHQVGQKVFSATEFFTHHVYTGSKSLLDDSQRIHALIKGLLGERYGQFLVALDDSLSQLGIEFLGHSKLSLIKN